MIDPFGRVGAHFVAYHDRSDIRAVNTSNFIDIAKHEFVHTHVRTARLVFVNRHRPH